MALVLFGMFYILTEDYDSSKKRNQDVLFLEIMG
jgi:hypothetical protein